MLKPGGATDHHVQIEDIEHTGVANFSICFNNDAVDIEVLPAILDNEAVVFDYIEEIKGTVNKYRPFFIEQQGKKQHDDIGNKTNIV